MAASSRSLDAPTGLGKLGPVGPDQRLGRVFERVVAPPAAFLRWLLENPDKMEVTDRATFGASSELNREWRSKLFSDDPQLISEAKKKGLAELAAVGPAGSRYAWWAFEGFSHIDCCLETERAVIFIEGKRTESVSPSTYWFTQRSQLWRNLEVAQQLAAGKQFRVILAVESAEDGKRGLAGAASKLAGSFPHLNGPERSALDRHLLGFVTWGEVVSRFGLPPECLIESI